ncbi:MAG: hypothetical protein ACK5P7_10585 [Bdellovibrio sp.]
MFASVCKTFCALGLLVAFALPSFASSADPCHQIQSESAHSHESGDSHQPQDPCSKTHATCCHIHVFLLRDSENYKAPDLLVTINPAASSSLKPEPELDGPFQPPRHS